MSVPVDHFLPCAQWNVKYSFAMVSRFRLSAPVSSIKPVRWRLRNWEIDCAWVMAKFQIFLFVFK